MRKDPRIGVQPPWEQRRLAALAREEAEVRALNSEAEWTRLMAPLADLVRKLAAGESVPDAPLPPEGFSPFLVERWGRLALALLERELRGEPDKATRVLTEHLCASLAADPGSCLADWVRLAQVLERIGGDVEFLDLLAAELLLTHEQELRGLPAHASPLELVDTLGALEDSEAERSFLEELSRREQAAADLWDKLRRLRRTAGTCLFQAPLWMQARLLARLGGRPWLHFVYALPHVLLRKLAVDQLQSPDEVLELVGLTLDESAAEGPVLDEVLVLLVQRSFALWDDIQRHLADLASGWFLEGSDPPGVIGPALAAEAEKDWGERELPEWSRALAQRLLEKSSQHSGFGAAAMTLRYLFVRSDQREANGLKREVQPIVREAFVQAFAQSGRSVGEIVGSILGARTTRGALLSAALVVLEETAPWPQDERVEQAERIWAAYDGWLQTESHILEGVPQGDEKMLAYALGGLLALFSEPVAAFEATFMAVRRPAEGWNADHRQFLESVSKVVHLLIVGVMASEQRKVHSQAAEPLFRFVWERLHSWLRLPLLPEKDEVKSVIVHVWARLWMVEEQAATRLALAELQRMDRLDWILEAANNLRNNMVSFGGPDRLPLELQEVIWRRFERTFPILKLRGSMTLERAAQYKQLAVQLTPEIQRASGESGHRPEDA